jgi:hypothetical protein
MKRWLLLTLLVVACSTKHYDDDDDGGSGGEAAGSGGAPSGGKGGASGSGASSAKGGSGASSGKGGASGKGGSDVGGALALGGDTSAGGDVAIGIGGAGDTGMPNGGEPAGADGGTGGTNGGTGGSSGGTSGAGGSTGGSAGQSSVSCDTQFSVGADGFVRMLAHDACWHGYAMSGADAASSVYPKTWGTCGADCQLEIIGTVGGVGYAYLGFNLNQAAGSAAAGTVTPTGTGIKLTHTYSSVLTAYLELITSSGTTYCVELPASGTTVPYTSFKSDCWDISGTTYAKQPLKSLEVSISGGESSADFDLHITSVEEI